MARLLQILQAFIATFGVFLNKTRAFCQNTYQALGLTYIRYLLGCRTGARPLRVVFLASIYT